MEALSDAMTVQHGGSGKQEVHQGASGHGGWQIRHPILRREPERLVWTTSRLVKREGWLSELRSDAGNHDVNHLGGRKCRGQVLDRGFQGVLGVRPETAREELEDRVLEGAIGQDKCDGQPQRIADPVQLELGSQDGEDEGEERCGHEVDKETTYYPFDAIEVLCTAAKQVGQGNGSDRQG